MLVLLCSCFSFLSSASENLVWNRRSVVGARRSSKEINSLPSEEEKYAYVPSLAFNFVAVLVFLSASPSCQSGCRPFQSLFHLLPFLKTFAVLPPSFFVSFLSSVPPHKDLLLLLPWYCCRDSPTSSFSSFPCFIQVQEYADWIRNEFHWGGENEVGGLR